jgi:23S rRNA pseudouridine1911/1915/1917 synthase
MRAKSEKPTLPGRDKGSRWVVDGESAGVRLDKYLAAADRLGSRGRVTHALDSGKVFLNEVEVDRSAAGSRLVAGDVVRVWMDRPGSARKRLGSKQLGDLRILFEDDSLIVLDKPAGLLSVPLERKSGADSVYHHIEDHLRSHRNRRPFVVHRIDRDTSGLVVFAKDARTQQLLKDQFRRREPERVYMAVVYGHPKPERGTWRNRLVWDQKALIQKETHPDDPRGVDAVSEYRTVERFRETALIEVRLKTGKRNQIRIQARLRGHTLVGERRYTFGPDSLRPIEFGRQALHAQKLTFKHPADGRTLSFEAPMPADMAALVVRLKGG